MIKLVGVDGYIYIAIGQDLCGIGELVSIPVVSPPPTNPPISYCSGGDVTR